MRIDLLLRYLGLFLALFLSSNLQASEKSREHQLLPKGQFLLAGVSVNIWGSYKIRHMLFQGEEWEFHVIIVPKDLQQDALIKIAKEFYSHYPKFRARFFSDAKYVQQYVDRDIYVNDKTGKVKEVVFPDSEWVKKHLLGNINNRSLRYERHWMLENRYGDNIIFLP